MPYVISSHLRSFTAQFETFHPQPVYRCIPFYIERPVSPSLYLSAADLSLIADVNRYVVRSQFADALASYQQRYHEFQILKQYLY